MYLNTQEADNQHNLLVYGPSGTGKTSLGVSAPDPVILLSERQGYESVKSAAKRLNKPIPPTFWIQNRDALSTAIKVLRRGNTETLANLCDALLPKSEVEKAVTSLPYRKPQTVVIDSVTEMFNLISDDIDTTAPPKLAKDGLPERTMRYWTVLGDRAHGFIRAARDLPFHVVMLALQEDKETGEGDEKARIVQPMTPMRKIPAMLSSAVNAVGVSEVVRKRATGKQMEMKWQVKFASPSWMLTKPLRPLQDVETPDITDWFNRLAAE